MTTQQLYARTCALPAIAAALALSSTGVLAQSLAQQTQPVPTEPAPVTTTSDAPAPDTVAPTSDAAPVAPETSTAVAPKAKRTARTTRATPAKPVAVVPHTAARAVKTHSTATTTAAAKMPNPTAATPPLPTAAPAVDLGSKSAPASPSGTAIHADNRTLEITAGGALALLALGGGAAAVANRRRRRRDQEEADERTMAFEPFETAAAPEPELVPAPGIDHEQPAAIAPSAFSWGNEPQTGQEALSNKPTADRDDRRPGETWVQRAYRGPTPNNPSVSLRNRLGRAAFFDKREREAAAGLAEPVDPNAGLPGALVEDRAREHA